MLNYGDPPVTFRQHRIYRLRTSATKNDGMLRSVCIGLTGLVTEIGGREKTAGTRPESLDEENIQPSPATRMLSRLLVIHPHSLHLFRLRGLVSLLSPPDDAPAPASSATAAPPPTVLSPPTEPLLPPFFRPSPSPPPSVLPPLLPSSSDPAEPAFDPADPDPPEIAEVADASTGFSLTDTNRSTHRLKRLRVATQGRWTSGGEVFMRGCGKNLTQRRISTCSPPPAKPKNQTRAGSTSGGKGKQAGGRTVKRREKGNQEGADRKHHNAGAKTQHCPARGKRREKHVRFVVRMVRGTHRSTVIGIRINQGAGFVSVDEPRLQPSTELCAKTKTKKWADARFPNSWINSDEQKKVRELFTAGGKDARRGGENSILLLHARLHLSTAAVPA